MENDPVADPSLPVPAGFTRRRLLGGGLALGAVGLAASCGLFDDDGPERFSYGDHPSQFSELWRPGGDPPWSTVVMIHGGAWSDDVDRTILNDVARDLAGEGHAVWNIEYRRLGQRGGGWPGTFADVAAATDDLAARADDVGIDVQRVVLLGHSAGGHLALWAAARDGLPPDAPGADPQVTPRAVVALAPVPDLVRCAEEGAVEGTCSQLMGGTPAERPNRYDLGSPLARLPLGLPQRLFHSDEDVVVPVDYSLAYVAAAQAAGDDAVLTPQPGTNHFSAIDPKDDAWRQVRQTVDQLLS